MPTEQDFSQVYARLRSIYQPFDGKGINASVNTETEYILTGPETPVSQGRELWFGGLQIKKNYVSCHLMAVYIFPDLLNDISPELKKRMQGKSCFNFKKIDESLIKQLETLTQKSYQRFEQDGWLKA